MPVTRYAPSGREKGESVLPKKPEQRPGPPLKTILVRINLIGLWLVSLFINGWAILHAEPGFFPWSEAVVLAILLIAPLLLWIALRREKAKEKQAEPDTPLPTLPQRAFSPFDLQAFLTRRGYSVSYEQSLRLLAAQPVMISTLQRTCGLGFASAEQMLRLLVYHQWLIPIGGVEYRWADQLPKQDN